MTLTTLDDAQVIVDSVNPETTLIVSLDDVEAFGRMLRHQNLLMFAGVERPTRHVWQPYMTAQQTLHAIWSVGRARGVSRVPQATRHAAVLGRVRLVSRAFGPGGSARSGRGATGCAGAGKRDGPLCLPPCPPA